MKSEIERIKNFNLADIDMKLSENNNRVSKLEQNIDKRADDIFQFQMLFQKQIKQIQHKQTFYNRIKVYCDTISKKTSQIKTQLNAQYISEILNKYQQYINTIIAKIVDYFTALINDKDKIIQNLKLTMSKQPKVTQVNYMRNSQAPKVEFHTRTRQNSLSFQPRQSVQIEKPSGIIPVNLLSRQSISKIPPKKSLINDIENMLEMNKRTTDFKQNYQTAESNNNMLISSEINNNKIDLIPNLTIKLNNEVIDKQKSIYYTHRSLTNSNSNLIQKQRRQKQILKDVNNTTKQTGPIIPKLLRKSSIQKNNKPRQDEIPEIPILMIPAFFKPPVQNGFGVLYSNNQEIYRGLWKNCIFQGKGKLRGDNWMYEGDFKKGKIQGSGTLIFEKYKLMGRFENNFVQGQACLYFRDKNISGVWKRSKLLKKI